MVLWMLTVDKVGMCINHVNACLDKQTTTSYVETITTYDAFCIDL